MTYEDRLNLLYELSNMFQTLNRRSNKDLITSKGETYLRYNNEGNIELRHRPTDDVSYAAIEFDVYSIRNKNMLYEYNSEENILTICLEAIQNMYEEYKRNGVVSVVLIYGRDIHNISEKIISQIQIMINRYNEYKIKVGKSSC